MKFQNIYFTCCIYVAYDAVNIFLTSLMLIGEGRGIGDLEQGLVSTKQLANHEFVPLCYYLNLQVW